MINFQQQYNCPWLLCLFVGLLLLGACYTPSSPSPPPFTNSSSEDSLAPNVLNYWLLGNGVQDSCPAATIQSYELAHLQAGDCLLRRGCGAISDYIADFLQEKYPITHCGLVLEQDSGLYVLHSVSNDHHTGILIEPIKDFVQQSRVGSLIAVHPLCPSATRQAILKAALEFKAQAIPFDFSFDHHDQSQLYCLELLQQAFLKADQQDWFPQTTKRGSIEVLALSNFMDSSRFQVLFNQFADSSTTTSQPSY